MGILKAVYEEIQRRPYYNNEKKNFFLIVFIYYFALVHVKLKAVTDTVTLTH